MWAEVHGYDGGMGGEEVWRHRGSGKRSNTGKESLGAGPIGAVLGTEQHQFALIKS
jgi:hypothetical protein